MVTTATTNIGSSKDYVSLTEAFFQKRNHVWIMVVNKQWVVFQLLMINHE